MNEDRDAIVEPVRAADGAPRTLFKPDPSEHGFPTNLDYFNAQ